MIVCVSGVMEAADLKALSSAGADSVGLVFISASRRCVRMLPSNTGLMPDYVGPEFAKANVIGGQFEAFTGVGICEQVEAFIGDNSPTMILSGIFKNDMPQNIITRVYNYQLQTVVLYGNESRVMIDNLRNSIVPDIRKSVEIVKAIRINDVADFAKCKEYEHSADKLLLYAGDKSLIIDDNLLSQYDCSLPFLIGRVTPLNAQSVLSLSHPLFSGIDIVFNASEIEAIQSVCSLVKQQS